MADAPEIKVKLTAEDTGVAAAIKELTSQLKTLKKQQDETAGSGLSLKKAFEGIVAAGAALELGRIGKDAFDSAVNIGKMADKTGLSTQALSVYHHVAEEAGVSTEAVDKALTKAAKSITEFEQGSAKAAKGFQLLGITQKDFAGLKPDEKIALVTSRLGGMSAGFQKATAAQLIFSRGGAEFIPVANAIAGEGFDKVTASVKRLGLLLDQDTTDSFRVAQASMKELGAVGTGMATQFEAGLLPAIIDVSGALTDSLTQGGVSFKDIGVAAGDAVKGIALVFLTLGQTIGTVAASVYEVFHFAWDKMTGEAKNFAEVASLALKGKFQEASEVQAAYAKKTLSSFGEELARQKAIFATLGSTVKEDVANLYLTPPKKPPLRPPDQTDAPEVTAAAAPTDAAARAALALLDKQLQDELAVHRAYAKQTEQVDKEMYDAGEMSLHEYFERRRAAVLSDSEEEIAIVQRGLEAAKASVLKAAEAKKKADTPKDADKQEGARLTALAKVDELETKITELRVNSGTKVQALNDEQFKSQNENQQKVLEFHRLIDTTQGNALEAAKKEIAIEQQKLQIILAQSGASQAQIDKELAQYAAAKTALAEFDAAKKKTEEDTRAFEIQKQAIEIKAKAGQISSLEKEKEINDLIRERLPMLRADAAAETSAAVKTGDQDNVAAAQTATQGVQNLGVQTDQLQQQVRGSLTNDFNTFFMGLGRNTASAGDQFRQLAASIVQSLEQIILKKLLLKALGGDGSSDNSDGGGDGGGSGGSGGLFGILSGFLGGHAEGGLIKGAGGPKSDSIPARVSPGEYIVKADAVASFGVHNLETINRGLKPPAFAHQEFGRFAEGGLVGGGAGADGGGDSNINLGIALDEGLILRHLSSKAAGNIIIQHLVNNPKAAGKALSRSG
jgi:hypothetical protein